MRKTVARILALAVILAMAWVGFKTLVEPVPGYYTSGTLARHFTVSFYEKRLSDLKKLHDALERYRADKGAYPVSHAWDGARSLYGASKTDWIPGLAPDYIPALPAYPVDEENTPFENRDFGYLYKSDGKDYKVMAYAPEDCPVARRSNHDRIIQEKDCLGYGFWTTGAGGWTPSFFDARLADLAELKNALEKYKADHGSYPASKGFDGLYSSYGNSGENWIAGLVPGYIAKLPRDPRLNADPANQYLYASDGKDFKLICHSPEDLAYAARFKPELIDPNRQGFAYGFWTPAAAGW